MTLQSLVTDSMRQAIGYETPPQAFEIDKSFIRRFAEGVEDANPLWQNEERARNGRFGGIVAPPSLLCAACLVGERAYAPIADLLPPRVLDGGAEWEVFRPVRPGDTITVVNKLAGLTEREGRVGPMLLISMESTWRNQRGEVVAKAQSTTIRY